MTEMITNNEARSRLKEKGLELLEDYKGNKALHKIRCIKHNCENNSSLGGIFRGVNSGCKKCKAEYLHEKHSLSSKEIEKFCNTRGIKLLEKYINSRVKLKFLCLKHNEVHSTSMGYLRSGGYLVCCGKEITKEKLTYTIEQVKRFAEEKNYEFLDNNYNGCYAKHNFRCRKHNEVHQSSIYSIKGGTSLKCCHHEKLVNGKRHSIEYVKSECEKRGFIYLNSEYDGCGSKNIFKCMRHNKEYLSTVSAILAGEGLKCCQKEKLSGSGNGNYNPKLTDQERINKRNIQGKDYSSWRKQIYKKNNYQCVKCGGGSGKLNAHHIFNWRDFPEKRFDIDNGITLCKKCHILFHKLFGNKKNTNIELDLFIKGEK